MIKKQEIIFKILTHKKLKSVKSPKKYTYYLKSFNIQVPIALGKKIDRILSKKMYKILSEIIDIYEENFYTNF
jgi:hypothetical protein